MVIKLFFKLLYCVFFIISEMDGTHQYHLPFTMSRIFPPVEDIHHSHNFNCKISSIEHQAGMVFQVCISIAHKLLFIYKSFIIMHLYL